MFRIGIAMVMIRDTVASPTSAQKTIRPMRRLGRSFGGTRVATSGWAMAASHPR